MPQPLSQAARILGERVRELRQKLAVSQDDVANLAGINVSNYGKIERGLSNPTFHTVVRIAVVLGVDPSVLVQGLGAASLPEHTTTFTARDFVRERLERHG
jgi:transcriptional regulator with XRE-family HTH domain